MAYNQLQLIEEIKKRPKLYSPEYNCDREEKLATWKEVGAAVYPDWDQCSKAAVYDRVLQLQRKYRSFRDAYNRELRSRRSGVRVNKTVYRYFKALSFLGGYDGNLDDLPNTEEPTQEASSSIDPLINSTTTVKKPRKRRLKKERQSSEDSQPAEEIEMPIYAFDTSENETDSDKLFLLSFLPEMKQLPSNLKMWARAQIANIMQEAVISHCRNSTPRDFIPTAKIQEDKAVD